MEVTLRVYDPRDAADLADVFFRSVRQVALSDYTADQVRAWAPEPRTAEWAHAEASDGRLVLVAVNEDDRPVAYIDLEPNGHINRLFCAPEAAGHGIASRLYDAVEAAARDQGIRSLFTEASELARRLFERKGFAVVERQDMVIRGVAIHNYRMAKDLDSAAPLPARSGGRLRTAPRRVRSVQSRRPVACDSSTMTSESKHLSERINRPADEVYDYASDPANLPEWAPGLGSSVEQVDGRWFVDTAMGRVGFAFAPRNTYGVLDHDVTLPTGEIIYNPLRVITDGSGSEVIFTLRRLPGMSDEEFERDADAVAADLTRLKRVLEGAGHSG